MAGWTTPLTWAAGNTVSAAQMNTYVRDNQNALISRTRAARTSGGTLPGSTASVLTFDSAPGNPLSMWVVGSPTRVTVPIAGTYRIRGRAGGSSANGCQLIVRKNGTTTILTGASATGNLEVGEYDVALVATDYVELLLSTGVGTYVLAGTLPAGGVFADIVVAWVSP